MSDLTKYNALIAWFTLAKDIFQLTREATDPATFRMTVKSIDPNNTGAGQKAIDYTFTDNIGTPYRIIAVDTNTIDVSDEFRQGCPVNDKIGIIHKSAYKGYSIVLPSELLYRLHPIAASNNNKYAMSILWGNDPNGKKIPFVNSDIPSIENYQNDQIIEGKTVNLYEDYGDFPDCVLIEPTTDESTGDSIWSYRTEKQCNVIVDNKITRIHFGTLPDPITGFILISRK